jgi:pimeloyl-ACP methyl ester carboxylesterase
MPPFIDLDLSTLEAEGFPPLPPADTAAYVERAGAQLWTASYGSGPTVLLLHGGFGSAGNFAHQVPALTAGGHRVIMMDSRAHGRSSWGDAPLGYRVFAEDALAVLDHWGIDRAAIVGWSDGADTGLIAALDHPERIRGLVFFACNVDATGTKPFEMTEVIGRFFPKIVADYEAHSPTPAGFSALQEALPKVQATEPNLSAADLARVEVPVLSLLGEHDEFITRAHAEYIAASIPGARFQLLTEVSHFAPLQHPDMFNRAILDFLAELRA